MDYRLIIIGMGFSFLKAVLQSKLTPAQFKLALVNIEALEELLYKKLPPTTVKTLTVSLADLGVSKPAKAPKRK